MPRYIVLLLITGIVWAQTDFDKLVLKDGTTYYGEYSKTEGRKVYFKPQGAFAFQPVSVKLIKQLQLKDGQIIIVGGKVKNSLTLEEYQKLSTKEKAIYDANLYDLKHWAHYGPISTIIFWGCTHLYLEDGKKWWDSSPNFLRGSSAASLTIPYFVLNWKEKFTYPKSLTDDDDRLYYKKIYSNKLKQRKFIYIVGSTIVTGAVAYSMFMYYFNKNFSMGDVRFGPH